MLFFMQAIYIYISVVGSPASVLLACPSWGRPLTSLSFRVISLTGDLDLRTLPFSPLRSVCEFVKMIYF